MSALRWPSHLSATAKRLASQTWGNGPKAEVQAPWTGETFALLDTCARDDVEQAFVTARATQASWAALTPRERATPFRRFHDLVLNNSALIDVIQLETGKARASAFEETVDIASLSLYYARNAPRYLADRRRKGAIPLATRAVERRLPKGVVTIISPWNYPLSLGACDVIPALLAGNVVVHKPDTQTALTALMARELLVSAGLPKDLWQIVIGEPDEVGDALVQLGDHLCFTGSSAAGRLLAPKAAQRLINCTLELGGKNPMLILDDADLARAARGAARACFSTAGQLCLSTERIYVAETVFERFRDLLAEATAELRLGTGFDFGYDIGSLTSHRQLEAVQQHVSTAIAGGAQIVAGGRARPDIGPFFHEPTVLAGVDASMPVAGAETFGPVAAIYPIRDDDHAIALANDTEYGLNASVWTKDVRRGRRVGAALQCGTVNINEGYGSAYASPDAPMGGMKNSGLGRRHGEHGLLEYVELQTLASQHVVGFDPIPGLTPERYSALLATTYRWMKRLRIK